ncbi:hypothetical protein VIGAN_11013300, partial [Vigna angularis var. angularis]
GGATTTTKYLDTFTEPFEIGSRVITLGTGKIATLANGTVVLSVENTNIFSAVTSAEEAEDDAVRDCLSLTVSAFATLSCSYAIPLKGAMKHDEKRHYREKHFLQDVIPTWFML